MTAPFHFVRHNRNPRTVAILAGVYAALFGAVILIDAAWWLMAVLALFTLPALWDLYADTSAGLSLTDDQLSWFTGKRSGAVERVAINHLRFDTRFDLSVRLTVCLNSGEKIRLPYEALPPHREFEQIAQENGIRTERHHFSIF